MSLVDKLIDRIADRVVEKLEGRHPVQSVHYGTIVKDVTEHLERQAAMPSSLISR
jgi:dihydroneopterin aldolase